MTPVLFGVALFAALLVAALWARHAAREAFEERFPPISDAEFLARLPPGTDPAVALKVRRMVAEYFAIEYSRVHPSMRFVDDIGAD